MRDAGLPQGDEWTPWRVARVSRTHRVPTPGLGRRTWAAAAERMRVGPAATARGAGALATADPIHKAYDMPPSPV
ncbi:hypothetical protein DX980_12725 [Burkholderia gladioli]|nr:hypothetical protein LvStA_02484 [Burkholderia gladioli]KKJ02199.1 hypothetical protein XF14_34790 [Burkholderia gladioli]POS08850.1 hypothetical protein C3Y08_08535 [Burkholderia gladioli]PRE16554.1 hypothetical protein C6P72_24635 [Burkholderia gladioli]PRG46300.1 hypothetical protein C6V06_28985 [Burkholderia gladioli]